MDFGRWMAKQGQTEEIQEEVESIDPISDKLLDEIYNNHEQLVSEVPLTEAEEAELKHLLDTLYSAKVGWGCGWV